MKNKLLLLTLSTGIAYSIAFNPNHSYANNEITNNYLVTASVQYNDFQPTAYWADDMLWAVDVGIISGYINKKHPTSGKATVGNWLNPYGNLTESQMMAVLMRYKHPKELNSIATDGKWFAESAYKLADKYNVPTKNGYGYTSKTNEQVSRGELARALVSLHYGETVSERNAVAFLYLNNLSTGLEVNGKYPKTYESYGVKELLKRSQVAAFVKRYHDLIDSGNQIVDVEGLEDVVGIPTDEVDDAPKPKDPAPGDGSVVNGIKVKYGAHTYGSKSQKEYDTVINLVEKELKTLDSVNWTGDSEAYHQFYPMYYINGENPTFNRNDPEFRSPKNAGLIGAQNALGAMRDAGISYESAKEVRAALQVFSNLAKGSVDPGDGSPESAYGALVHKLSDCDSAAQLQAVVFDMLGYNTMVLAKTGHAAMLVEVEGVWLNLEVGVKVASPEGMLAGGWYEHTQPTR